MEWWVDRDEPSSVQRVGAELEQYVRRHGAAAVVIGEQISATLQSLLRDVCRCAAANVRVELEWGSRQPVLSAIAPPASGSGGLTESCRLHAKSLLAVHRPGERTFVLAPVDPHALPAPEEFGSDGLTRREALLKALVVQAASHVEQRFGPDALDEVITGVGSDIGNRMGDEWRKAAGIVERLPPAQMGELFVELNRAIGGDFYVIETTTTSRSCSATADARSATPCATRRRSTHRIRFTIGNGLWAGSMSGSMSPGRTTPPHCWDYEKGGHAGNGRVLPAYRRLARGQRAAHRPRSPELFGGIARAD